MTLTIKKIFATAIKLIGIKITRYQRNTISRPEIILDLKMRLDLMESII